MIKKEEKSEKTEKTEKGVKKMVKRSVKKVPAKFPAKALSTKKMVKKVLAPKTASKIVKRGDKEVVKKSDQLAKKKVVKVVVKKEKKIIVKEPIKTTKESFFAKSTVVKGEEIAKKSKDVITQNNDKYFQGIGKRKRAVANVRIYKDKDKVFIINNKPANIYFNNIEHQKIIYSGLEKMGLVGKFKIQVLVRGGGLHAQAEAIRHGISRALLNFDETFRQKLKMAGFLTRDPRRRERKKPGLKRARKAKQWRKR